MNRILVALLFVMTTPAWLFSQALPEGAIARLALPPYALPSPDGSGVALSPDGKLAVTGDWFEPSVIWDVEQRKIIRRLGPNGKEIPSAFAWSANGRWIAEFYGDTSDYRVFEARTGNALGGKKTRSLGTKFAFVSAMRFVDQDRLLAFAYHHSKDKTWHVELAEVDSTKTRLTWSVDQEKQQMLSALGKNYAIRHISLSPLGGRMSWLASPDLTVGKSVVFIHDTATGKLLHTVKDLGRAHRAEFADEGATLVLHLSGTAKVIDGVTTSQLAVVNVADGRVKYHCPYRFLPPYWVGERGGKGYRGVEIARSAFRFRKSIVTIDEFGMTQWDLATGKKLVQYDEPFDRYAVAADESRIAVSNLGRLRISKGDFASLNEGAVHARGPSLRFLPDGRLLSTDSTSEEPGVMHLWDVRKGTLLHSSWSHAYPADLRYGASHDANHKLMLYQSGPDNSQGPTVINLATRERVDLAAWACTALLSPDGLRVLAHCKEGNNVVVRWFAARDGRELGRLDVPLAEVPFEYDPFWWARWFAADGSMFGYQTSDYRLKLIDAATKKTVRILGIVPDPRWKRPAWMYESIGNGRLIWARPGYGIDPNSVAFAEHAVWDRDGRLVRRFSMEFQPHKSRNELLSPDGRTLAFYHEREAVLLDTATGRPRGRIPGGVGSIGSQLRGGDFSPDSTLLANTSAGGAITIWDLARPLSGKAVFAAPTNAKQTEALWDKLGDPDPTESDHALWALVKAPEPTLAMLKERLKPELTPDARPIEILIRRLESTSFAERDAASKELRSLRAAALPMLRAVRKGAMLEQGRRLEEVIANLQARLESRDAIVENLRVIRALEILERIGSPEARRIVESIASGADAVITFEAQLVLARWPSVR